MSIDLEHIGSRMVVARHILGKERAEIARQLDISSYTYGKYERGQAQVIKVLPEVAKVLCVPTDFLTKGPIDLVPATALSYRRKVSLKSSVARHVQGMASICIELASLIDEHVTVPAPSLPYIPIQSATEIEDAVRFLRSNLNMSDAPLRDAVALAESFGVLVFWIEADRTFDGVSFWCGDRPYILLNKNQLDGYRSRFTLLHEIGHLIHHRGPSDTLRHEEERKRLDREADMFASAFLMPASSYARRFPRFGSLFDILEDRSYWKASCAAMVRRAWQLNLIDEDRYRRLNVGISARGWRLGEPNTPLPEKSRVHQFFLDEVGEYGLNTRKLSDSIAFPISWLREAFPLSEQYQSEFTFDGL